MSAIKLSGVPHTTAAPQPSKPVWLTQEWLEPRLVAVTLLGLILTAFGGQAGWPPALILALHIMTYIAGGLYGFKSAVDHLRVGQVDVDLLMILAAVGAASIGSWHEGGLLLFLFSLSNVLQDYAIGRSRSAIKSLFKLYPEETQIRRGDKVQTVSFDAIQLTDTVLIAPGARIPVDGVVVEGHSAVDQSPITGESIPVEKTVGDKVFAGTLNKHGSLDLRPTKLAGETTLARIIQMVEEAQENQAPAERFLERFEQVYAKFIIVSISLFIIIPPLLGWTDFTSHFYRAMVLMTVASPCALVISVPAAFISAIASAARMGVLMKGGAFLEELANVKLIAFDKTGTLTAGQPRLVQIATHGISESELLSAAAAVESRSEHPLAEAIVQAAKERKLTLNPIQDFQSLPGQGVQAQIDGHSILVGSAAHLETQTPLPSDLKAAREQMESSGQTTMGVLRDGEWIGLLAAADTLRPDAPKVIADLRALGIEVAMLTGDQPSVAQAIAKQAGVSRVFAGLMPEDKVTIIKQLQAESSHVAMVGDGVNDAPALALANVGIAMGAAGTDVALETADVVLMGDQLARLRDAILLSRKARRVVWQNIIFSLGVIVVLVISTFAINLPLPLGVFGHEGSTVLVVLNGLISLLLLPEIQRRRTRTA
jgi:Zn2+/Cd2+-exporting ATPase